MTGILENIHNYITWQKIKKADREESKRRILDEWIASGKQIPPPHEVKQEVVRKFQEDFAIKTLVETGTFRGEMVYAQRNRFNTIISIELSEQLHLTAVKRLKDLKNVTLIRGDSAEVLEKVVGELREPAIFWLDGHYSGFETAKGDLNTPINKEMNIILGSEQKHILLIDDARLFTGENDYPAIQQIRDKVDSIKKNYQFAVEDDIIRIYPDFKGL